MMLDATVMMRAEVDDDVCLRKLLLNVAYDTKGQVRLWQLSISDNDTRGKIGDLRPPARRSRGVVRAIKKFVYEADGQASVCQAEQDSDSSRNK